MIKQFELQLFSEEKTEKATPKKLRDARKKGQVVQSKDINSAIGLIVVFFTINLMRSSFVDNLIGYFISTMNYIPDVDSLFTSTNILLFMNEMLVFILQVSLPFLIVAMVVGVGMSYAQVGFIFTFETIKPKLSKINPIKGFKNIFSTRSLMELFKSVAKAVLVLYIAISYIQDRLGEFILTIELEPQQTGGLMWQMTYDIVLRCSIMLIVIGVIDFAFKKWKNNKELMMTKKEVKDEYKQSEGDPQLKAKIKERQRAISMNRMMQQVPKADVIITNPTHFAIALKYDSTLGDAPIVLAKGQDLIAQNIKKIAAENAVPIVENKPLAQTLYKTIEVGQFIPPDLYEAVAEVLAYVYKLNRKQI